MLIIYKGILIKSVLRSFWHEPNTPAIDFYQEWTQDGRCHITGSAVSLKEIRQINMIMYVATKHIYCAAMGSI